MYRSNELSKSFESKKKKKRNNKTEFAAIGSSGFRRNKHEYLSLNVLWHRVTSFLVLLLLLLYNYNETVSISFSTHTPIHLLTETRIHVKRAHSCTHK